MHRSTARWRGNSRHQMSSEAPADRTRRRVIAAAAIAIVSTGLVSAAVSQETPVVAIIHPMQPIGNIDCCH